MFETCWFFLTKAMTRPQRSASLIAARLVSLPEKRFNREAMGVGYLAIIISAICYGCNPLFSTIGNRLGYSVLVQLAIRFLGTSVFLLPVVMASRKRTLFVPWRVLWKILVMGGCSFGLTSVLLYESYRFAPSGVGTTIHFIYPVFVMVISVLIGREHIERRLVFAIIIASAALLCIVQPWKSNGARAEGILLAFASSLTFSLYVVFIGNEDIRNVDDFALVFWLCISAGMFALFAAFISTGSLCLENAGSLGHRIAYLVLQPMITSVVASTLFAFGVRTVGGTRASILSMFEPATAVVIGIVFLSETADLLFVIGFFLLFISVYLTMKGSSHDRVKKAEYTHRCYGGGYGNSKQ
ncbi:MAG: DMT family transporter [Sphaerochaetaceae bacterium]|jgi:drug/metabolite transporter (DMT)-like permease